MQQTLPCFGGFFLCHRNLLGLFPDPDPHRDGSICLVVYLLAGIVHSSLILLAVGTVLTVGTVFVIKMLGQRRERITSLKQRNS